MEGIRRGKNLLSISKGEGCIGRKKVWFLVRLRVGFESRVTRTPAAEKLRVAAQIDGKVCREASRNRLSSYSPRWFPVGNNPKGLTGHSRGYAQKARFSAPF